MSRTKTKYIIIRFLRFHMHQPGNEHEYKVTIAIAEILMSSDRINGIAYPSIAEGSDFKSTSGSNLALKPKYADDIYCADECWVILIEKKLDSFKYEALCTHKAKSVTIEGDIIW